MKIAAVPFELETASPENWEVTQEGLSGQAGSVTDLFLDPFSTRRIANAPALLFPIAGDCLLEAEVQVEFKTMFDAGVLLLWQDETHWAKLCFEFSPQGIPMVVSVVTHDVSDDCNSVSVGGNRVHLRVGRRGMGCVFHYSEDGKYWHMVRAFRLADKPMKAGFLVQSPRGQGSRAEFRAIRYREQTLPDIRSGA